MNHITQATKKPSGITRTAATHGGARSKAGRKPVTDPKVGVTIYLHQSEIDANGGIEDVKTFAVLYLKKRGKKK